MRKSAENTQRGLAQTEVHAGNESHQQQHEDEHRQRPEEQFLGGFGDRCATNCATSLGEVHLG